MTASHRRRCLFALLFAALLGAPFAPGYAAETYDAGLRAYEAGDHAKALKVWGPLAEGGHEKAQYSLGKLLENGGGPVQQDAAGAAKWYQRAADQGLSAAQNNLGLMYAQGRGVPRDVARAARLWLAAAEKDHTIAQFNLGLAYFRGEGGEVIDEEGFFDTGDVAHIDKHGYMQITDRSKDVIKSGGEWISSIDLENIAVGHPQVAEAAVIGIAHPKWDERPLLVVVAKGDEKPARDDLLAFIEGKVARWWLPDDVVFVDEIPHTATGKILKSALREQFADYRLPTA